MGQDVRSQGCEAPGLRHHTWGRGRAKSATRNWKENASLRSRDQVDGVSRQPCF